MQDPSSRLGTFAKEIRLLLPTAIRLNRGNLILQNLVGSALSSGLSDISSSHLSFPFLRYYDRTNYAP